MSIGNPAKSPTARDEWAKQVKTSLVAPVVAALLIAGVGFGGFLAWASTAPLAGAVMAPGHVAANGENQTIQHLEGGIVKEIHVREGDSVVVGQPLISLDPTLIQSNLNRARNLLATLRIEAARLIAEQRDQDEISFPPEMLAASLDLSLQMFVESKKEEFELRTLRYRNEIRILEERVAGLNEEISGTDSQRIATQKQAALVKEELKDVDYLFQKGLARQDRLFALRRSEADLEGRDGALQAQIGKAKQSIAEVRQQIEKLGHERRTEAGTKLTEMRTRIADTAEQIVAYENVLSRVIVRAPASGTIVRLNINTVGAVISPGQAVVELLPGGADLVIEAKLQPNDIDAVQVGRPASVRLSALNHRTTPVLDSRVVYVSADKLTDSATQQLFYRVRLSIDRDQLTSRDLQLLSPGMPAETFIKTSERTMLRYLFRPIEDSFARALREE
jgi:HlyD family type I secretion membrane fusion protein